MPPSGTAVCFHCSDPLPRTNPYAYRATIDGETRWFCCPACQTVTETIQGLGLSDYYARREQKPLHAAKVRQTWSDMDLPDIQATFIQPHEDGSVEADLLVADIHCASCCWLIEHRLRSLPGMDQVQAQLGQQKVHIRWKPALTPASSIFAALASIGYCAAPWHDTDRQLHAKAQKTALLKRTGVAGIVAMQIHMIAMGNYFGEGHDLDLVHQQLMNGFALLLSIPVWFYSAQPFFSSAWRQLRQGYLGMDLPVTLAILTAAIVSIHSLLIKTNDVYFDSIAMFVFLLLGARYLEARARSRLSIHAQAPVFPQSCSRISDGTIETVSTNALAVGDNILVHAGETIVADGIVTAGSAAIEQALITGEYKPIHRQTGESVLAGSLVRNGNLTIQVKSWGKNSQIAQLQQRVEAALDHRDSATVYDVVAHYFTPVVLLMATATGIFWYVHDPAKAIIAMMAVLVASCPCALSLAIPTVQAAAISSLRQQGILVTGSGTLLKLPNIGCFAFDKTGSLTEGRFSIINTTCMQTLPAEQCQAIAAALETNSTHPIATAFLSGQLSNEPAIEVTNRIEHTHRGIEGDINGEHYRLGCPAWLDFHQEPTANTTVILANQQGAAAQFTLGDTLRADAIDCIRILQAQRIHCSILSGDASGDVQQVANMLHIPDFHAACTPDDKVRFINDLRKQYGSVAMLGDGINDGPVLAQADVSLTFAEASQTARLAADVLLLNNRLSDIQQLLCTARYAQRIARQNVTWAFLYNICILPVAAAGLLPPAAAALGMATSSLLVTLNALRLLSQPDIATSLLRDC